jgi:hypothetical protein
VTRDPDALRARVRELEVALRESFAENWALVTELARTRAKLTLASQVKMYQGPRVATPALDLPPAPAARTDLAVDF